MGVRKLSRRKFVHLGECYVWYIDDADHDDTLKIVSEDKKLRISSKLHNIDLNPLVT